MLKLHSELLQEKISEKIANHDAVCTLCDCFAPTTLSSLFRINKEIWLNLVKYLHIQVGFYFLKLVNFKDFINGYTALHWAAKHGNIEIIKLLAGKHQADVNIKSYGG